MKRNYCTIYVPDEKQKFFKELQRRNYNISKLVCELIEELVCKLYESEIK